MPVTSSIAVIGRGTVIIGTVEEGTLRKGEKLEIVSNKLQQAVASEIQVFGKTVKEVSCSSSSNTF